MALTLEGPPVYSGHAMSERGDSAELVRRKALARDGQVVRGVLVRHVVDRVRELAGEEAARACAPHLHGKLAFAAIAATDFLDLLGAATERVAAHGVGLEALCGEVGRRAVLSLRETTLGRTFVTMAEGDPLKIFTSLGAGPSILVAFGERRVLETSPGRVRIAFSGSLLPPRLFAGMYCAMAEAVGGQEVRCVTREAALGDSEYVITWR